MELNFFGPPEISWSLFNVIKEEEKPGVVGNKVLLLRYKEVQEQRSGCRGAQGGKASVDGGPHPTRLPCCCERFGQKRLCIYLFLVPPFPKVHADPVGELPGSGGFVAWGLSP